MGVGLKLLILAVSSVVTANASSSGPDATTSVGAVRLAATPGTSPFSGQAEVSVDGEWTGLCHSHYTDSEAAVLCRELQCEGGRRVERQREIAGPMPTRLYSFNCTGKESRLRDCSYSTVGSPSLQVCRFRHGVDTACIPVAGAPQSVQLTSLNHTSLQLSWFAPISAPCQLTEGYRVQCRDRDGNRAYTTDHPPTLTTVTVQGLAPYTVYECCVTAHNSEGASESTSCSLTERTLAAPPLNISITQVTPYTVSLSWAPPPARGSGKVKGYVISVGRIKRKPGGSVQNVSTSNTSKTISGLSADTKYELRVSTKTHTGVGAFSEPVIFRTKIYAPQAVALAAMVFSIVGIFLPTLVVCIAVASCYKVPKPCGCFERRYYYITGEWMRCSRARTLTRPPRDTSSPRHHGRDDTQEPGGGFQAKHQLSEESYRIDMEESDFSGIKMTPLMEEEENADIQPSPALPDMEACQEDVASRCQEDVASHCQEDVTSHSSDEDKPVEGVDISIKLHRCLVLGASLTDGQDTGAAAAVVKDSEREAHDGGVQVKLNDQRQYSFELQVKHG